ncbi:MAG TPA: formate dehydrogenase accessory sulfurtransferase FdhD [Acidimicrobiales bacterium]|nr:formate dehydrogenase accessory sulfurtransferase FdhD [Acidimicrobiales bacterium]
MAGGRPGPTLRLGAVEVTAAGAKRADDTVVTEEPLEVRLAGPDGYYPVAVTMRTPGADFELAIGFLYGEGVIGRREDVRRASYCVAHDIGDEQRYNIVNIELAAAPAVADLARLERHFSMTSACGVCGKATLGQLRRRGYEVCPPGPQLDSAVLCSLPDRLRQAQRFFELTGGLHAAGLFSAAGELLAAREDVGRHNALDKLVGWALMSGRLPVRDHVVVVSGRASFELVQKALAAGAVALCSVSAPSSLAVELAREFELTLAGFVRPGRLKLYSGAERVLT